MNNCDVLRILMFTLFILYIFHYIALVKYVLINSSSFPNNYLLNIYSVSSFVWTSEYI